MKKGGRVTHLFLYKVNRGVSFKKLLAGRIGEENRGGLFAHVILP